MHIFKAQKKNINKKFTENNAKASNLTGLRFEMLLDCCIEIIQYTILQTCTSLSQSMLSRWNFDWEEDLLLVYWCPGGLARFRLNARYYDY